MTRTKMPIVPVERIAHSSMLLRGQRVILDRDLAQIYGVSTKRLNKAVKRHSARFPHGFMFRLTPAETEAMSRSQTATGSRENHDARFPPYVFTEHGAVQAANVVASHEAVLMSIHAVRAIVHLRTVLASNQEVAEKHADLQRRLGT